MEKYYIFNTFFNEHKDLTHLPHTDLLLWATSIICYKKLGYKVKLYCLPQDFTFLKEHHLYELYDEFDTTLFQSNELLQKINPHEFWSNRKLIALNHEVQLGNRGIYSDVDIIMFQPFDIHGDLLVWSNETDPEHNIYRLWDQISVPDNYQLPEFLYHCNSAYNGGILWFKNAHLYQLYFQEYLKFTIGNPCNKPAMYACNAEQRILKAVANYYDWNVQTVADEKACGLTPQGNHYFYIRGLWRRMDQVPLTENKITWLSQLNYLIVWGLDCLKDYPDVYQYYAQFPEFQSFLLHY